MQKFTSYNEELEKYLKSLTNSLDALSKSIPVRKDFHQNYLQKTPEEKIKIFHDCAEVFIKEIKYLISKGISCKDFEGLNGFERFSEIITDFLENVTNVYGENLHFKLINVLIDFGADIENMLPSRDYYNSYESGTVLQRALRRMGFCHSRRVILSSDESAWGLNEKRNTFRDLVFPLFLILKESNIDNLNLKEFQGSIGRIYIEGNNIIIQLLNYLKELNNEERVQVLDILKSNICQAAPCGNVSTSSNAIKMLTPNDKKELLTFFWVLKETGFTECIDPFYWHLPKYVKPSFEEAIVQNNYESLEKIIATSIDQHKKPRKSKHASICNNNDTESSQDIENSNTSIQILCSESKNCISFFGLKQSSSKVVSIKDISEKNKKTFLYYLALNLSKFADEGFKLDPNKIEKQISFIKKDGLYTLQLKNRVLFGCLKMFIENHAAQFKGFKITCSFDFDNSISFKSLNDFNDFFNKLLKLGSNALLEDDFLDSESLFIASLGFNNQKN